MAHLGQVGITIWDKQSLAPIGLLHVQLLEHPVELIRRESRSSRDDLEFP
jgi:hypothetical protein